MALVRLFYLLSQDPVLIQLHHSYCKYIGKDPDEAMHALSLRRLHTFFDWILNQRRGKGGRRLNGVKSANTLSTYWKVFRLVYESSTGVKIDSKVNRRMHRVNYPHKPLPSIRRHLEQG